MYRRFTGKLLVFYRVLLFSYLILSFITGCDKSNSPKAGFKFTKDCAGDSCIVRFTNSQISGISLKTSPFLIYSSAFRIEWWPGEAHWGLSLTGYYLTGEAALTGQQINFQKTTDALSFSSSSRLQMLGGTLGVHVYLKKGKTYYKRPSDYYATIPHRPINIRRY